MNYVYIPDTYHPSLQYGADWSAPGVSGHYIRANKAQDWTQASERPDLTWGTARQAAADQTNRTITIAEIRALLAEREVMRCERAMWGGEYAERERMRERMRR